MNLRLLFPHRFKKIGWIILIPSALLGILVVFTGYEIPWLNVSSHLGFPDVLNQTGSEQNLTATLAGVLVIVGAMLAGFSRERNEDEYISRVRLESLLWAVYVNYGLLLLCFVFFYGLEFLNIMALSMFTVLIIFIARFNFILYRNSKRLSHEK